MAINYGAKLFETESTAKSHTPAITSAVKAGALVVLCMNGKRSGANLNISSILDTNGNVWDWRIFQSQFRTAAVAWTRTSAAMPIGSGIGITWNGTPTYAWKSAHSFEGASGTPIDEVTASGNSGTASVNVGVSGSDWLVVSTLILPDATAGGITILNSGVSRDDNAHSGSTPWTECWSRNGTTGTVYTAGATLPSSQTWGICAVSFPFLAMPASPARAVPGLIGI